MRRPHNGVFEDAAILALGLSFIACKEKPPPAPAAAPVAKKSKVRPWLVTGTLDAPHYELDGRTHAHVKAKFRMVVDRNQPYDLDLTDPVPNASPFELLSFEATDLHAHLPSPDCAQPKFTGTYAWEPKGGLYQVNTAGFTITRKRPAYQLPNTEGKCDSLAAVTPAGEDVETVLFPIPFEVIDGESAPQGGFLTVGSDQTVTKTADAPPGKWLYRWTEP